MSLYDAIANDYRIFDRVEDEETITHVSRGLTTNTVDTVEYALGRAINRQEAAASGGYYTTQDRVWHFGVNQVATDPKEGDQIIQSDGVIWHVLTAHHETLKTRWRLVTRKERAGSTLLHLLQAHWKLNATSGDEADSVGANTVTAVGSPGSTTGKLAGARTFDGSTQYFSIADNTAFSTGNVSFTPAAWVRFTAFPAAEADLFTKWRTSDNNREWRLYYDHTETSFAFRVSPDGSTSTTTHRILASTFGAPALGTWYLVVGWHDADNDVLGISVNAIEDTKAYTAGAFDSAAPVRFAADGDATAGKLLTGALDSLSFVKRAWSKAERLRVYNGGLGLDYPFHAT